MWDGFPAIRRAKGAVIALEADHLDQENRPRPDGQPHQCYKDPGTREHEGEYEGGMAGVGWNSLLSIAPHVQGGATSLHEKAKSIY